MSVTLTCPQLVAIHALVEADKFRPAARISAVTECQAFAYVVIYPKEYIIAPNGDIIRASDDVDA